MADKHFDIVELKTSNFPRWRNDLQVALIFAKCSIVVETEQRPLEIEAVDWERMSANARAIILKALRDDFWRVSPADTPFQVVQKISAAFQPTSSLITIINICKFFALSQGIASTHDVVKDITSSYSELRRSIEASDVLRNRITIHESVGLLFLPLRWRKPIPMLLSRSRRGLSEMPSLLNRQCHFSLN